MPNVVCTTAEKRKIRELPRKIKIEEVEKPKKYVADPVKTIAEHRKVRELPRKMKIEEVEKPKKYENYHAKPVADPFKTIAEHRKVRELPRKINIEEVEEPEIAIINAKIPSYPRKYENSHTK